jgi:hypothetical protein
MTTTDFLKAEVQAMAWVLRQTPEATFNLLRITPWLHLEPLAQAVRETPGGVLHADLPAVLDRLTLRKLKQTLDAADLFAVLTGPQDVVVGRSALDTFTDHAKRSAWLERVKLKTQCVQEAIASGSRDLVATAVDDFRA